MAVTAMRTVVLYIAITASMRLMGKRQLGQLHPTELAVALMIADLAVIPMQDVDLPLLQGLLPIAVLIALELLLSACMLKWPRLSRAVSGNPVQVVQNGKPLPYQLKRLRMSLEELCEQLRQRSIFDLSQVHSAFVESDGQLSVFLYGAQQPAVYGMLGGDLPEELPFLPVVADGAYVPWAVRSCGITDAMLQNILQKEKLGVDGVLLLMADAKGRYTLIRRRDTE